MRHAAHSGICPACPSTCEVCDGVGMLLISKVEPMSQIVDGKRRWVFPASAEEEECRACGGIGEDYGE